MTLLRIKPGIIDRIKLNFPIGERTENFLRYCEILVQQNGIESAPCQKFGFRCGIAEEHQLMRRVLLQMCFSSLNDLG